MEARGRVGRNAIDPNAYLAIYNENASEFLIFFDRTAGGDIGWPSSETWGTQLKGRLLEEAKELVIKAPLSGGK